MKNSNCEDLDNTTELDRFQETWLSEMDIPEWMHLDCPFCGKKLPLRSIRSVGLKFNTRNIGDVVVEVLCDRCKLMDTVYFRNGASCLSEFIALLKGETIPKTKPVLEEDMFKLQSNNAVEEMLKRRRQNDND